MHTGLNSLQNNALSDITARAPKHVVSAIERASEKTGVDFAYMVQQAQAESGFEASAKAKTSSATGLYQFIKSTWLDMVEKHGEKYGIDPNQPRSELLKLRNDPEAASYMAAEFAAENKAFLQENWGGDIGATEQYFAHFMGAGGASSFLSARDNNPSQKAAYLFPKAASANRSVFYDTASGRAKTLEEVYAFFDKKFQVKSTPEDSSAAPRVASNEASHAQSPHLFSAHNRPSSVIWQNYGQRETVTWNQPAPVKTHNPVPSGRYVFNSLDLIFLSKLS